MRTTVDLPPSIMERVKEIAAERDASISATIAELTMRGITDLSGGRRWWIDEETGLPVVSSGLRFTTQEIKDFIVETED